MAMNVNTKRYHLKVRVKTPRGTERAHDLICYGLNEIARVHRNITPEKLRLFFPEDELEELKRPEKVELLISHREGRLASQRLKVIGDRVLWESPLRKTVVLLDLKDHIERHGFTLSGNFGLPEPNPLHDQNQTPHIIQHETEHNMEELHAQITQTENTLNLEQQSVVKTVIESVEQGLGKMITLDASGGTGKTFVLCHILNKVCAKGKVALATAASGIAATLLPKGTTFHSRTKCPLILTDKSACAVSEHDNTATLIRMAHLMVVDEVTIMDRHALEAADRTFRWLRRSDKPFGGITMVFGGDWRHILTVVPHDSRTKIIGRCCKSSYLWKNVETLSEFTIKLNDTLTISGDKLKDIVNWAYKDMLANISCPTWLCERVILCPTNSEVDTVNEYMTKIFSGEEHVCNSVDTADSEGNHMYPTEFLNTLCPSGMPHRISLKVGMVIMLLRNFDQQNGHCNGSRYIIEEILPHLLVTKSVIGVNAGRSLIPSDNIFPFTLRRKQFPVRPCFAMTVNKSQGQSLQRVGVFSTRDFFSHGQFYVAASRVRRSNKLRILGLDEETKKNSHMNAYFRRALY
uniref:ATP-dependent DNA helicase n=1 Tax=Gouania willdenowi TaxID=441366 RepID=A0A8C5E9X1_GOUWI